jgi:homocitrate synthase NifV
MLIIDVSLVFLAGVSPLARRDAVEWTKLMRALGVNRIEEAVPGEEGRLGARGSAVPGEEGRLGVRGSAVPGEDGRLGARGSGVYAAYSASAASLDELFRARAAGELPGDIRLHGLDDALLHWDMPIFFSRLRSAFPDIEPAFGNSWGCATALGVEWLRQGGRNLVCSFAGIGGLAPLEEVVMALCLSGFRPRGETSVLAGLRGLFERLGGETTANNKAVIGPGVFAVESGIHVDGLAKEPTLYEPFPPESVGARRVIVMGPHSGRGSVRLKCAQLGLRCDHETLSELLDETRSLGRFLERSLADDEFVSLHRRIYEKRGRASAG